MYLKKKHGYLMSITKIVTWITLGLAVFGCTSRPDSIAPVSVSALEYKGYSCEETQLTLNRERAQLSSVSSKQEGAANVDTLGVLFLGLPVGKILGQDVKGQVALSKGKVQALERAVILNCREDGE